MSLNSSSSHDIQYYISQERLSQQISPPPNQPKTWVRQVYPVLAE